MVGLTDAVSVAVIVWLPAVFKVTLKAPTPAVTMASPVSEMVFTRSRSTSFHTACASKLPLHSTTLVPTKSGPRREHAR